MLEPGLMAFLCASRCLPGDIRATSRGLVEATRAEPKAECRKSGFESVNRLEAEAARLEKLLKISCIHVCR